LIEFDAAQIGDVIENLLPVRAVQPLSIAEFIKWLRAAGRLRTGKRLALRLE
jgi:hypothetical protein